MALLCAAACEEPSTRVQYVSAQPLGKWFKEGAGGKPGGSGQTAATGGKVASPTQEAGRAGAADSGGALASGGMGGGGAGGNAGKLASGGSGGSAQPTSGADTALTLAFTTVTQHMGGGGASCKVGEDGMSYGPCNVGAVWVAMPDGTLVKVLAAWGGLYSKHLIRYKRALGSLRPDVKTTATLKMNAPRTVAWDHTDLMQRPLPPGPYKLLAEVADFDTMKVEGKQNAVLELDVDTQKRAAAPVMDMTYYTDIELRYE